MEVIPLQTIAYGGHSPSSHHNLLPMGFCCVVYYVYVCVLEFSVFNSAIDRVLINFYRKKANQMGAVASNSPGI